VVRNTLAHAFLRFTFWLVLRSVFNARPSAGACAAAAQGERPLCSPHLDKRRWRHGPL